MKIEPIKGKYVLAVSGGVDSVVLLDLLNKMRQKVSELDLVVAHFDHGIREDSSKDRQLVESLASKYELKFYYAEGRLGPTASEQQAREARYDFLNGVTRQEIADGLITAHHQDDQIETAILNIIRGTGRKGLSSLTSGTKITRPLLDFSKLEIIDYARANQLNWREDPTNLDLKYLRNYIRHEIVPKLDSSARYQLVKLINDQASLNKEIDQELTKLLNVKVAGNKLERLWLSSLDNSLSKELLATWLRQNGLNNFDHLTIERLSSDLKTINPGRQLDVLKGWRIFSTKDDLALRHLER